MSNHRLCLAVSLALLLVSMVLLPFAEAQSNAPNVRLHLTGPSVLGTLRSGSYSATFADPDAGEWDYKIYITASNTTGASPLVGSPINGTITSDNTTFIFEVTAPQRVGEMDIHINCTKGSLYYHKVQRIFVVSPVFLKADVNNPSNIEIKNATVQFYVDGIEIDKQTIVTIAPLQKTQVSSEWISQDREPGWHTMRVVLDLNGDGIINTHAGDQVIEDRFYIEGENDWIFAITVLVGLMALILGFGYISKRKIK